MKFLLLYGIEHTDCMQNRVLAALLVVMIAALAICEATQ